MEQEKFAERVAIFNAAVKCEKPKRVPSLGNAWAWKILDTDLDPNPSFQEATSNWEIMEKIVREHFGRYAFDSHVDVGFRFNSSYQQVLQGKIRHFADEEHGAQALDAANMNADEYDKLIAMGPQMFEFTTLFPRMFGDLTFGELQQLIGLYGAFGTFVGKMYGAMVEDFSLPILAPIPVQTPFEELFNYYRGIKELSLDMRKQPGKILDYIASQREVILGQTRGLVETENPAVICSYCIPFLAPTVMNLKQFEKFYLPLFHEMLDLTKEKGKSAYIFIEGETTRFVPYLEDYKGSLVVHVENDNLFELRPKLPGVCLAGGMPVRLLDSGTEAECVAYAKKLCDELGPTGYVFSTDKMMAYACDGKRENLKATMDFVSTYEL